MSAKSVIDPDDFLRPFPPGIVAMAGKLRAVMRAAAGDMREAVYPGWRLLGYRARQDGREVYVGYIAPFEDRLVLGFEWGCLMADPAHILAEAGRQVRAITFRRVSELKPKTLRAYAAEAVRVALLPKDEKTRLLVIKETEKEAGPRFHR